MFCNQCQETAKNIACTINGVCGKKEATANLQDLLMYAWGEQTDVPESADWYNSSFLMLWGSNVPLTRTPDSPFYTQVRYKGTKSVVIAPDYSEAVKFADLWIKPRQGTDAALGMAMGHVILKEFYLKRKVPYFEKYARQYSDLPFLVKIEEKDGKFLCGTILRASDMDSRLKNLFGGM